MEDNKLIILMEHTIHHNEHHSDDFSSIASSLREEGVDAAASLCEEAAASVKDAVTKLKEAKKIYEQSL